MKIIKITEESHWISKFFIYNISFYKFSLVSIIILIGKTRPKSNQYKFDHTDLGTFQPLALVRENNWGYGLKGHDLADFKRAKNENKQWYDYHKILDDNVVQIDYFKCYDPRWNKYTPEEIKKVAEFIIQDCIENILGFSKKKQWSK